MHKIKIRMANSVDPNEMAHYKPSHLDLYCLRRYLFWSVRLNGLTYQTDNKNGRLGNTEVLAMLAW